MHSIIICKLSNQSGVFFNLNFNIFCEYVTFNNLVNGDKTSNSSEPMPLIEEIALVKDNSMLSLYSITLSNSSPCK